MDYNKLNNPKVKKLIQVPLKPHTPQYMGEALNSNIRSYWIEFLFNYFDKIHNSGTLRCPFPWSNVLKRKKFLPTRFSFEVKLTDVLDFLRNKGKNACQ